MFSRFRNFYSHAHLASLYFAEGLPFAVVVAMPAIFLKNCGADNAFITFWTSILALPWTLKTFWAPLIDRASNLGSWIFWSQLVCSLLCFVLGALNFAQGDYRLMLCIFGVIGYAAATQDLAIDAHYLAAYDPRDQSNLMWLRNTAFRIAYLLGAGIFVSLAGYATETKLLSTSKTGGWSLVFALVGLMMGIIAFSNRKLFGGERRAVTGEQAEKPGLLAAVKAMIALPAIWKIVLYTLVFRIGDAFLSAMAQPFMLDSVSVGGLGLKTSTVGFIYGTFGAISLIAGGVFGGIFVSKIGARRLLVPFSLLQSASIFGYFLLVNHRPEVWVICGVNAFEQFCFGLTTSCYSVVLLTAVNPRYRATHFAIICAVMNLGLIIPSMVSGAISDKFGYASFFLISFVLSLIGPFVSLLLPAHDILDNAMQRSHR